MQKGNFENVQEVSQSMMEYFKKATERVSGHRYREMGPLATHGMKPASNQIPYRGVDLELLGRLRTFMIFKLYVQWSLSKWYDVSLPIRDARLLGEKFFWKCLLLDISYI